MCASGNSGPIVDRLEYPGKYPETIAVGAINQNLQFQEVSSRGNLLDVVAPGECITSTWKDQSYATISGSSQASPFVSGIIALMLAKHRYYKASSKTPVKSTRELREHLTKVTIPLKRSVGSEPMIGFRLLDPLQLIKL